MPAPLRLLALFALLVPVVLTGCDSGEPDDDDLAQLRAVLGCNIAMINLNQSVNGALSSSDCRLDVDDSYIDYYAFRITSTSNVTIDHMSTQIDPYLYLFGGTGSVLAQHDDIIDSVDLNARITRTLEPGLYAIGANSYDTGETGSYTVRVTVN